MCLVCLFVITELEDVSVPLIGANKHPIRVDGQV